MKKIRFFFKDEILKTNGVKRNFIKIRNEKYFNRRIKANIRIKEISGKYSRVTAIIDTGAHFCVIPYGFWSIAEHEVLVKENSLEERSAEEFGLMSVNPIGSGAHNIKKIPSYFGKIQISFKNTLGCYEEECFNLPAKLVRKGYKVPLIIGLSNFLDKYKSILYPREKYGVIFVPNSAFN